MRLIVWEEYAMRQTTYDRGNISEAIVMSAYVRADFQFINVSAT